LTTPLLATKLYIPPSRPHLVSRTRLLHRLDEGLRLGCRLTLLSAPAGYGKTTLLSEWIAHLQAPDFDLAAISAPGQTGEQVEPKERDQGAGFRVAWLSLDEGDDDPGRFLAYLVAALQRIDERIGGAIRDLLEAPKLPPLESLVTILINDLAAVQGRLLLALDDYHALTGLDIHRAVGLLLERLPPQMHMAIATRQDPPLPLSRLRARGQVTECRESHLRFTPAEASTFLSRSLGLALPASDIARLEERTEGWIAGLQLAGLSIQGRDAEGASRFIDGFSGRHHFVLDYLTDEILQSQPGPIQAFLLKTSILERMTAPLCDAVLAQEPRTENGVEGQDPSPVVERHSPGSQEILDGLERANLFVVPLDDERRWYRYHRLFADLLRARHQEKEPEWVPELHRRAAAWYERHGFAAEAVHHAFASQDGLLATDVVERAIQQVATWTRVDSATFLEWLDALPGDVVRARPRLQLYASRALFVTGQWQASQRLLQELERTLRDDPTAPGAAGLLDRVLADRASYAAVHGDVGQAIEYARQALARLPKGDPSARIRPTTILGLACFRAGDVAEADRAFSEAIASTWAAGMGFAAVPLVCNQAEIQIMQGQLRRAMHTCERAMQMGTVDGEPVAPTGFAELEIGKILYEWNELQVAERHVLEGLERLGRAGIPGSFGTGHALLARIKQAQGDGAGALAAIQQAVQLAEGSGILRLSILTAAHEARIWLARARSGGSAGEGALDRTSRWAAEYRRVGEAEYLREFEDLTLVRVLLAEGSSSEALDLLDALQPTAKAAGRMGSVIEILALRALTLQALGDASGALHALGRALRLAEPEGYVRLFVDEGEQMARLLYRAAGDGIVVWYGARLLAAFEGGAEDRPSSIPSAAPFPSATVETGVDALDDARGRHPLYLVEPLTSRELEVLELLAGGLSNREIGQQLVISLPTVKSHTRNIYGKLGVHSRKEAVSQARTLGILPAP
jgi:LuxR family maltose regulon positive regulatory protein